MGERAAGWRCRRKRNMALQKNHADKAIVDVSNSLSDRNRAFIYHLVHGQSASGNPLTVYEAYQKAGYEGDKHAAYELKSRLEREIMQAEITRGASKADIFREIAGLMQLPAVDKMGAALTGISATNKIKVLALAVKAHEVIDVPQPKITAVNINMGPVEQKITVGEVKHGEKVVNAEVVKGDVNGQGAGNSGEAAQS